MKVVIPMAGYGKRLRPHTFSRPKPLVNVAGKPLVSHIMSALDGLDVDEYIFIVGYLGEQIQAYIEQNYAIKARFIVQEEMLGQAHAIYLAKDYLQGPVTILFSDTIFEADINAISRTESDGLIYAMEVDDPSRFGVVVLDEQSHITRFVEKPDAFVSNLAVIGLYYLKEGAELVMAIETQMARNKMTKGEFFIADAFQVMVEEGYVFTTAPVDVWLDCGKPETVLETNQHLLENGSDNSSAVRLGGVTIIPPVFVHPQAKISHSIIGPNATISADCEIEHSIIRDSIVDDGAVVMNTMLSQSLIGRDARVIGRFHTLNVGDSSSLNLE